MTARTRAGAPHQIRPSGLTPRSSEEPGALPVRLAATLSREFARGIVSAAPADFSALHRSLGDLSGLYGATYRPDLLDPDCLVSYKYMASELLRELGTLLGEVDLVVLAYATPEIDTRDFVGCFLADAVPGGPLVFSISDQGPTAPFMALRLAGDYLEDRAGQRALVLALDQHTIPWEVPDRAVLPTCNAAVAVVVDRAGGTSGAPDGGTRVWQCPSVAPQDVGAKVEAALASVRLRLGREAVLVAGRDTPLSQESVASAAGVVVADRGRVCTGVWHALDEHRLDHPDGTGPVVVADYDPEWRYLGVAVFDGAAADEK